jgi:hypothetical protein
MNSRRFMPNMGIFDLEPDELGRDLGQALASPVCPAIFDRYSATLDPAEFAQSLHKSGGPPAV